MVKFFMKVAQACMVTVLSLVVAMTAIFSQQALHLVSPGCSVRRRAVQYERAAQQQRSQTEYRSDKTFHFSPSSCPAIYACICISFAET